MGNSENLQEDSIDDTINIVNADGERVADMGMSEDTAHAYQATIDQQGDTIDALLQANERLQKQIQRMLRNGASITDDTVNNDNSAVNDGINPPGQIDPQQIMNDPGYEPLSALGREIGKKPNRK